MMRDVASWTELTIADETNTDSPYIYLITLIEPQHLSPSRRVQAYAGHLAADLLLAFLSLLQIFPTRKVVLQ